MKEIDVARERYERLGVDIDSAISGLEGIPLSLHCWQGDDVGGFETPDAALSGGGIQVTGNYPGKARSLDELRSDLDRVYSLIPGTHRLNLHASYGDFAGERIDRDAILPEHFASWADWAGERGLKLDFNATMFSHPLAEDGFTLSHRKKITRDFWIEHVKRARDVSAFLGRRQGSPSVHNLWIPDGSKDLPADRMGYRTRLKESLDKIYSVTLSPAEIRDAVEAKLFGIGSEAFVVGSHEFYMGYALTRDIMICLDTGHFHPTESVADKISAVFQFQDELLLHVSRPMRWDSDHIVLFNDDIIVLMQELKRSGKIGKTHIGLDFFDATVNRIGAWAVGARAALKGLLYALLEPTDILLEYESSGNLFARLALMEEMKTLPFGIVWNHYCRMKGVPEDGELIGEVTDYECKVLSRRK